MMRKYLCFTMIMLAAFAVAGKSTALKLEFNPENGKRGSLTMPDGTEVNYTAYERLYFVTAVADSAYQYMNVYVPDGATQRSPIFLRTFVGGYMASAATMPHAGNATGRALREGYVVAIPGSRGRNSTVVASKADKKNGVKKGDTVFTGRAPNAILDLKAAIRYLRHFDGIMPGDAECIITDGVSAGGAMSALMGATGNHPDYEPLLKAMGAADERDDVFAAVCYCPITDLDHADAAYEWLYNGTESRQSGSPDILSVSNQLKAQFTAYINSLNLIAPDGTPLTADNYLDFIKQEIIRSAQIAKNAGADIPDTIGFSFSEESGFGAPPVNGGMTRTRQAQGTPARAMMRPGNKKAGEYIIDLDMDRYLNYVVSTQPLKTAPAFDTQGVAGQAPSGENELFGDSHGSSTNFTHFGSVKSGVPIPAGVIEKVGLLNPMNYIGDSAATVAPHWYIRHGARDRDTAYPIPLNLALRLQNTGHDVNYLLAWNRPHSGDYALDELFEWIHQILQQ